MKEKIINFIKGELNPDKEDLVVQSDEDLLSSGLVESMGMMRLIQFVETEFLVKVEPKDMTIENFITVDAISQFVNQTV